MINIQYIQQLHCSRVSIARWNLKEAGCEEHTNSRANLWSDGQKSHMRLCKRVAVLFDKDETNVRKHINNVFKSTEVDKDNNTQKMRVDGVKQPVAFYSLDVILAVGYRVNSQRGIAFRKWANNVLKQFILKGYAINEKRLQALEKTVDIHTKMLAGVLDIEEQDVLRAVNEYTDALLLLDQYDHQALCKVCIYGSSSKEKESQNILEKTSTTFLCF